VVEPETVLNRFFGSAAVADLTVLVVGVVRVVVGRVAVVEVAVRVAGVAAEVNRPTGLLVEAAVRAVAVAGFLSAAGPATLDRRSTEVVVGLRGARVEVVPAMDMRFAVPEIPRFSSPELATDRGFSSAELLTDIRDRWDDVVEVLNGFRVAVVVVVGRVGGLFKVLLLVLGRDVAVVGFDADDDEVGRLVAVVPDTGRFTAPGVPGLALAGEALGASLTASGLDLATSSPPERTGSTGVAGGSFSSTSTGTSSGVGATTGSSVDDMMGDCWRLKY
jgi:hypothetical protein